MQKFWFFQFLKISSFLLKFSCCFLFLLWFVVFLEKHKLLLVSLLAVLILFILDSFCKDNEVISLFFRLLLTLDFVVATNFMINWKQTDVYFKLSFLCFWISQIAFGSLFYLLSVFNVFTNFLSSNTYETEKCTRPKIKDYSLAKNRWLHMKLKEKCKLKVFQHFKNLFDKVKKAYCLTIYW